MVNCSSVGRPGVAVVEQEVDDGSRVESSGNVMVNCDFRRDMRKCNGECK